MRYKVAKKQQLICAFGDQQLRADDADEISLRYATVQIDGGGIGNDLKNSVDSLQS